MLNRIAEAHTRVEISDAENDVFYVARTNILL